MTELLQPVPPTDGNKASEAPKGASRLLFIDGLRALAMLLVLICHYWYNGNQWHLRIGIPHHFTDVSSYAQFGFIGVDLFLVLSGFCLYWPFVNRGPRQGPTLVQFLKRRSLRILPPYYVCLVAWAATIYFWPGSDAQGVPLLKSVVWHALMLHNLRVEYVQQINGAFWSLALEFQLYLLFPVVVEAFRRFNPRLIVLLSLVSCVLFRSFLSRGNYSSDDNFLYVLPSSLFGRHFEFVLGMFVALLVSQWHSTGKSPLRPLDFGVTAVIIAAAFLRRPQPGDLVAIMGDVSAPLYTIVCGLFFAGLLLQASRTRTWLHRTLSARSLVFLGTISYSIYLIHLPLITLINKVTAPMHFSDHRQLFFQTCILTPVLVSAGYLFHLRFERPFMPGHPHTERQAEASAVISPAP
jgi:peptidoglycan/LPS O-acetylase OafA/YrhL